MLKLGTTAPDFSLSDVTTGKAYSLSSFTDKKGLLMMFICRHCPYVKHVETELAKIGNDYADKEIGIVAVSANDADNYPDDKPESLKEMASELGFKFPYLYDESQGTAKIYTAACTPDFFLFDKSRKLVYRGQLDDSRPENQKPLDGRHLRAAINCVLADQIVSSEQKPSIGCNIKWKKGNAPSYG
jgi:peroxiredoxin